jgi:hypothetical protein
MASLGHRSATTVAVVTAQFATEWMADPNASYTAAVVENSTHKVVAGGARLQVLDPDEQARVLVLQRGTEHVLWAAMEEASRVAGHEFQGVNTPVVALDHDGRVLAGAGALADLRQDTAMVLLVEPKMPFVWQEPALRSAEQQERNTHARQTRIEQRKREREERQRALAEAGNQPVAKPAKPPVRTDVAETLAEALAAQGDERIDALRRLRKVATTSGDTDTATWARHMLRNLRGKRES